MPQTDSAYSLYLKALDSTLTFKGTYQVGMVNFNFYLPDTILTCPARGVIEYTWKSLFCSTLLVSIRCLLAIALSVLRKNDWISLVLQYL